MADNDNLPEGGAALGYQIFHELGKLTSACDAIVRDMSSMRVEIGTRSAEMLRQLTEHTRDDTINFAAHDQKFVGDDARLKSLENARATLKGVIMATNLFWIVVTGLLALWINYKGG